MIDRVLNGAIDVWAVTTLVAAALVPPVFFVVAVVYGLRYLVRVVSDG